MSDVVVIGRFNMIVNRVCPVWILAFLILFASWSDDTFSQTAQDTSLVMLEDEWGEETYYSLELLRLERWLADNLNLLKEPSLLDEVVILKRDADGYAARGDYALANEFLQAIWSLLQPDEPFNPEVNDLLLESCIIMQLLDACCGKLHCVQALRFPDQRL